MNQQQTQQALQTGLKMLDSDTICTPNKWNTDLANLQQLIVAILSGQLVLVPGAGVAKPPEQSDPPPGDGDLN